MLVGDDGDWDWIHGGLQSPPVLAGACVACTLVSHITALAVSLSLILDPSPSI